MLPSYPIVTSTTVEASLEVKAFMADVTASLKAIEASLKALESMGTPAKREEDDVTVALSKMHLKGPHALAKKAADFELDPAKVTNAMLWFKFALAKDVDGLRVETAKTLRLMEGCTQLEVFAEAKKINCENLELCAKLEEMYYCELGRAVWRIMGPLEKDKMKAKFEAWRATQKK